jgi:tetratricopeptide (TPR) repeat protein
MGLFLKDRARWLGEAESFARAEDLLRRSLALRRELHGDGHSQVATALDSLGGLYYDSGRHTDGCPLLDECWQMRRRLLGDDHPLTLRTQLNLATCLWRIGRLADAQERFDDLLPRAERSPDLDAGARVTTLFYAGRCNEARGDVSAARSSDISVRRISRHSDRPGDGELAIHQGSSSQSGRLFEERVGMPCWKVNYDEAAIWGYMVFKTDTHYVMLVA